MQVICRQTSGPAELHCCVCGQGFVIFWERETPLERIVTRCEIQEMLRRQHKHAAGRDAHPQDIFVAPEFESAVLSGSAAPLHPPVWDL